MCHLSQFVKTAFGCSFFMLGLGACAFISAENDFNPKTCLQAVPTIVPGIEIIQGHRTKTSLAFDMQNTYCNGQVLLKQLNDKGLDIGSGTVWFKVTAEYTGEVINVDVVKTEITSKEFLQKTVEMIMDSDFTPHQRDDLDSQFIYPLTFTDWWIND